MLKHKRKIIGRVRATPQTVIRIQHPADFFDYPQPDSTHVLTCPKCGEKRYVDHRFVESLTELENITHAAASGVIHRGCEVQIQISPVT